MFPSLSSFSAARTADDLVGSNRTLLQLTLILILSAFTLSALGGGSARAALAQPVITAEAFMPPSGLVSIQGNGFTPGGRVQIVVVDHWGNTLHEPVWTMASSGAPFGDYGTYIGVTGYGDAGSIDLVLDLGTTTIYGQNGSQDPANGYANGAPQGTSPVQIRAFDEHANTWSDFAEVIPEGSLEIGQQYPIRYALPKRCVAFVPCGVPF